MNLYYKRAAIFGLGLRRTQCQNVRSDSSATSGGRTHYEILGVHRLATQKEIKDAYLQMSKKVEKVVLLIFHIIHEKLPNGVHLDLAMMHKGH